MIRMIWLIISQGRTDHFQCAHHIGYSFQALQAVSPQTAQWHSAIFCEHIHFLNTLNQAVESDCRNRDRNPGAASCEEKLKLQSAANATSYSGDLLQLFDWPSDWQFSAPHLGCCWDPNASNGPQHADTGRTWAISSPFPGWSKMVGPRHQISFSKNGQLANLPLTKPCWAQKRFLSMFSLHFVHVVPWTKNLLLNGMVKLQGLKLLLICTVGLVLHHLSTSIQLS